MALRRDDRGNAVLLLAGILLILSFVTIAHKLAEKTEVERQAATEQSFPITDEWKAIVDHLSASLTISTTPETGNTTFAKVFESTTKGQVKTALSRGHHLRITLADCSRELPRCEWSLTADGDQPEDPTPGSSTYEAMSVDGALDLSGLAYDGVSDGLVWTPSCERDATASCIQAFYVYLTLSDGSSTVEETILFPLNVEAPQWPGAFM